MALKAQPDPYTQILYLTIPPEKDLTDPTVAAGHSWSRALDIVEAQPGFIRLSWGRSPEDKSKVQLHTGKLYLSLLTHQQQLTCSPCSPPNPSPTP